MWGIRIYSYQLDFSILSKVSLIIWPAAAVDNPSTIPSPLGLSITISIHVTLGLSAGTNPEKK